jgi:uncharacterized protein YyaL (SSP411 family)
MLYDNGQLVKLYADAYRLTGNRKWKRVFEETIAYVLRDMTHPEGGFYASEDADSEGEEGKFYVWTPAEVKAVLGDTDGATACRAYGVTERGNFEHGVSCNAHEMSLMAGLVTLCDSVSYRTWENDYELERHAKADPVASVARRHEAQRGDWDPH